MPKDPPTKIKVTEMSKILRASDDSVFLVVQNGVGHKISFLDLKNSIIDDLRNQVNLEHKNIEKLEKHCNSCIVNLSTDISDTFNQNKVNLLADFDQYIKTIDQNNSEKLDSYINKIEELTQEIDKKKLQKITSKNTELSKKFESFKKDVNDRLSEISNSIDEKYNNLSAKIYLTTKNISETLNSSINEQKSTNSDILKTCNQLSSDVDIFKEKSQSDYQKLSAYFDDFDVKLYGLTINEVDLDENQVVSEQVRIGDIQMLSSQISMLEKKINGNKQ